MGRTPYLGWLGTESARDRTVARQAMEETGVWHLADRLVGQLSGGEQQRVVVARALAQEPRVLLLDEPTAHLDINHQMETLMLVKRLVAERRLAALAIFHDLNLAAQYCDELVLLDRGRIVSYGPPAEVLTPEAIARVYGAEVDIVAHPQNGLPIICPQFPSATTPS
jgi:iron complex transport system ATP-binding protein